MMKNQKGITLIALVITIIVLLILAGVSIAMLTGDHGILTQANKATVTQVEGRVDEEVRLAVQAANLEIQRETANDASWSALTNISTVTSTLTGDLKVADKYAVTASSPAITITYTGDDYRKATNDSTASITYTLTVEQHAVKIDVSTEADPNPVYVPEH